MKLCRRCRQIKPLRFFHLRSASRDGHRSECAACSCAAERARRAANVEKVRASQAASYARNRAARAQTMHRWRERNRARHRAIARAAYERNREAYIARASAWNAAHPDQRREQCRRRRARLAGSAVERVDYAAVLDRDGAWCYLCDRSIAAGDLEFDHVIPVARGGAHVASNIRPTHGGCNRAKGARLLSELALPMEAAA